jgi:regulatory protein
VTRARVVALRLLAQRRLSRAQLTERLARRGYPAEDIRETVASCEREGYLDDLTFAQLFIEGRAKAVGDARLAAELVQRGIDREVAIDLVSKAERNESERLGAATEKLFRTRPSISYPSAARALERLGFSTSAIYRMLREHAQSESL